MTNGSSPRQGWSQAHIDIGALAQRVTGLENAIGNVGEQLRDISKRLDAKPTDVWKIVGGIVGILALVGAFLYQGKAYIDADLNRHEQDISHILETAVSKDDFKEFQELQLRRNLATASETAKVADELTAARIQLAKLEGSSVERHEEYLRESNATRAHVDAIDGNLIKRPEVESIINGLGDRIKSGNDSANDRISSVIQSLNELRHDFGANFTLGDAVKELQLRINGLQFPQVAPAPPPR